MTQLRKFLSAFSLLALLLLTFVTPVSAFDGRSGDRIVIEADEVIADDLYVAAQEFVLNGTVKGDLIVFAQTIWVNGTVEGDLIAAGQTVIVNGTVTDDVRIAGAALQIGDKASIGSDLVAAGASLETKEGSDVNGELVVGSGQALLAGEVAGDVLASTGGLELRGSFGGDIQAYVGEANEGAPPMTMYMTNSPITMPSVRPGLTIDDDAQIAGKLEYTSTKELSVPGGVVGGQITRLAPEAGTQAPAPTAAERAVEWSLDLLRSIVTLILFGLLLGWLFPKFVNSATAKLQAQPWPSLGWGVVAWAAYFVMLLVIILAIILGGVIFGWLTLGSLSGTVIWLGILALFGLTVAFVLVTSFVTKVVVGWQGGKWIMGRFNPSLAEHKVWPLVLGVVIVAILAALPLIGWLLNLLVIFFGLGALWLWGRERLAKQAA